MHGPCKTKTKTLYTWATLCGQAGLHANSNTSRNVSLHWLTYRASSTQSTLHKLQSQFLIICPHTSGRRPTCCFVIRVSCVRTLCTCRLQNYCMQFSFVGDADCQFDCSVLWAVVELLSLQKKNNELLNNNTCMRFLSGG